MSLDRLKNFLESSGGAIAVATPNEPPHAVNHSRTFAASLAKLAGIAVVTAAALYSSHGQANNHLSIGALDFGPTQVHLDLGQMEARGPARAMAATLGAQKVKEGLAQGVVATEAEKVRQQFGAVAAKTEPRELVEAARPVPKGPSAGFLSTLAAPAPHTKPLALPKL